MSKIASNCIYTIVNINQLNEWAQKGGSHNWEEGKPWVTGKALLKKAKESGEKMFVVFTPAERCTEIVYFAELENIVTLPNTRTTFFFKNITPTPDNPTPLKENLVVSQSGEKIPRSHIRPYVICNTPEWLEEIVG